MALLGKCTRHVTGYIYKTGPPTSSIFQNIVPDDDLLSFSTRPYPDDLFGVFVCFGNRRNFQLADVVKHIFVPTRGQEGLADASRADEALKTFFTEVEPLKWAASWPESMERIPASSRATEAVPPPTRGPNTRELLKRSDSGELPARYAGFLEVVRETLRAERYAYRTEETYLDWLRRFLVFASPKSRREIEAADARQYLEYLTLVRRVSASTQNQALNAIQFLFSKVLKRKMGTLDDLARAPQSRRLPTVLSRTEVRTLLDVMEGTGRLMADLMYGAGLRVTECARLRIKDVDFGNGYLVVRGGKGDKDRFAPLPESLKGALRAQIEAARERWKKDRAMGVEGVFLPEALAVKYVNANKDWKWFWLFPSPDLSEDPWTTKIRRHHLNVNGVQRLVRRAAWRAISPSRLRRTRSGIHLLRICSRRVRTYARCKSWAFGRFDDDDLHACAWAPKCRGEIAAR